MNADTEYSYRMRLNVDRGKQYRIDTYTEECDWQVRSNLQHEFGDAHELVLEWLDDADMRAVLGFAYECANEGDNSPVAVKVRDILDKAIASVVAWQVRVADSKGRFDDGAVNV